METIRFGAIMRATAVETNAIADLERRLEAAQAAQEEAELAAEELRVRLAAKAGEAEELSRMLSTAQLEIGRSKRAEQAAKEVAQHLLTRNQRLDAAVTELLEHLQPTLAESDRRQRHLVANAYEAMGAAEKAAAVFASGNVRLTA